MNEDTSPLTTNLKYIPDTICSQASEISYTYSKKYLPYIYCIEFKQVKEIPISSTRVTFFLDYPEFEKVSFF